MARSRESTSYEITALDRTRAGITSAKNGLRGLDNVVTKLGINFSLMGTAGALAPGLIVAASAPAIDRMGKLSESTGIAVDKLQAMEDASSRAGVELNALAGSLQEGLKRISETSLGSGEAGKALNALGLDAKNLKQQSPEEQIRLILEALEDVEDKGDKIQFADKIFGGQGVDLIRLTTSEIDKAADELERLNLTLTETDVAGVEEMNDQLQRVQRLGFEASKVFTSGLAPGVTAVTNSLLGMGSASINARDAGSLLADGLVTGLGFVGDTVNNVRRGIRGLEFVFQATGTSILEVLNKIPGVDLTSAIAEEQAKADVIFGKLGEIPDRGEFSSGLQQALAEARQEATRVADEIETARRKARELLETNAPDPDTPTKPEKETRKGKGNVLPFESAADIEKRVQALIETEERAEQELIDARKQRREDLRFIQDPLSSSSDGSDLGDLEERLQRELTTIQEQYEEKRELLSEIAANDEQIARDQSALEQELFRDKERAKTQIAADGAQERVQIQRNAAFALFNIAADGLGSLIKNEERAKKFQQGISKARALMAGVEAAEKARAYGATLGGVVGGQIAYGLSWAATLASVATIDSAASGGSGGSAGSSGAGGAGSVGSNDSLISSTSSAPVQQVTINLLTADEIIDNEKLKERVNANLAASSKTRDFLIDPNTLTINLNGEAA